MNVKEKKFLYVPEEQTFQVAEELANGAKLKLFVGFGVDKFVDYQKDLVQDFVAEVMEKVGEEESYDIDVLKSHFEIALQNLNTKLKAFAYYSLSNTTNMKGKIDLFSDFVEGDVENTDELLYVGIKISDVLDTNDFKDMEQALKSESMNLANFLQDVLHARIDKKAFSFIFHYAVTGASVKKAAEHTQVMKYVDTDSLWYKIRSQFLKNKYQVTVAILGAFILFMLINLLSQVLKSNSNTVVTSNGVTVGVTIDSIKKDLLVFQGMDPTSEEKSMKYKDLTEKLNVLESEGKRLEDVASLKKVLQSEYYKGFNISYISSLSKFDDLTLGKKSRILTFNDSEKSQLGAMMGISMWSNMIIEGASSALVGAMDDNLRGVMIDYTLPDGESIKGCSANLLKDGIYCFTPKGTIISVTKAGSQMVTNGDGENFSKHIGGIATYGKANMYIFESTVSAVGNTTLVTRYRNTLGSQTIYQGGQKYYLTPNASGASFGGSGFSSFAVDGSFLTWYQGKLLQFRRNPPTAFTLDYREVKLLGGDTQTNKYSNNVKIISSINSKYVYLFDKDNQTFTVYESRPAKNGDQFASNYSLYYIFSYKFDLGTNPVIDVEVPDPTGNKPELYILTSEGVNKVSLSDYIDSIKQNNVLKTTASQ
ncbi:MAG: hypothetical protein NTX91_03140 [candidate division SR1 bacterium]|nr:hypothetical protein [candidate division SR1 bacterium]